MADLPPYQRTFSFAGYQANLPKQPVPGLQIDRELDEIAARLENYGKSAYDLAVLDGFQGTRGEWLLSLRGPPGPPGPIGDPLLPIGTAASPPAPYLSKIAYGQSPVLDMFGPYRDGVRGDEALINNILNGHNECYVKPASGGIGPVTVKDTWIQVPQNGRLESTGAKQACRIVRDVGYSGDTIRMGTPTVGCGSAVVRGFRLEHPGRFVGLTPSDYVLQNRLTAGQAHIRAYGVQGATIEDIFDFGMPFSVVHQGGSGLDINRYFKFAGMYNPLIPAQQEGIGFFASIYDPVHGYPVNCNITDPNIIGGNIAAAPRTVAIDNKSYTVANPRIGMQFVYFLRAFEVLKIRGGFGGGAAQSNFFISGGGPQLVPNGFDAQGNQLYKPAWVLIRLEVDGHSIDECMYAAVEFARDSDDRAMCSTALFHNCSWHGQLVQARGIEAPWAGRYSVANLHVDGGIFTGYQGSCVRLGAALGGSIKPLQMRGYNIAGFDTSKGDAIGSGAGIYLSDQTRNVLTGPTTFGGGPNFDTDPNSIQYGYVDLTPVSGSVSQQGNRYYGLNKGPFGLTGGGVAFGGEKFAP